MKSQTLGPSSSLLQNCNKKRAMKLLSTQCLEPTHFQVLISSAHSFGLRSVIELQALYIFAKLLHAIKGSHVDLV